VDAEREFIAGNLAETRQLAREQHVTSATPVVSSFFIESILQK
jgi:hypothetical protein